MKSLNLYISERLVVNKDYKDLYTCEPKTFEELRKIIEDRYNKFGPGTKDMPIDFNDVDVSDIDSFYNNNIFTGIFAKTKFKYIDVSDWNVSKVEDMHGMFSDCKQLESVGDLSNWNVSNVKDMNDTFSGCEQLKSVGDLSKWNVSKVEDMQGMFSSCEKLISVGDLSNWNVSNVKDMSAMFSNCKQLKSVGDISNWKLSNARFMYYMFAKSGITNIPKWYKR